MLETLADHDDELMEQLLGDIEPPKDKVFDDLGKELRDGLVCPVLMGAASRTNGVLRLMKALRHETPDIATTVKRLGVKAGSDPIAYVLKTLHTAHGGRMSVARILNGQVGDGTTFQTPEREAGRVAGVFKLMGQTTEKRGPAQTGETVALAKLDHAITGDTLTAGKQVHAALPGLLPIHPCSPSRWLPRSGRTTSSSVRHCTGYWRRTPRSRWSTIPRRTRSLPGARARCICAWPPKGWPIASA